MSNTLAWNQTPNPAPAQGQSVTWTTTGGDGTPITWGPPTDPYTSETSNVVTLNSEGCMPNAVNVVAQENGMATITATQSGNSISRIVGVGALFAYGPNSQGNSPPPSRADSDTWFVTTQPPSPFPSFDYMQQHGYGVAYIVENGNNKPPDQVVINWDALHTARESAEDKGDSTPYYFTVSANRDSNKDSLASNYVMYVYAPDGTLWQIEPKNWQSVNPVPDNFPSKSSMDGNNAGIAWEPEAAVPPLPLVEDGNSLTSTCYVLDVSQFPLAGPGGPTYYTVTAQ